MKKIITILAAVFLLVSCDENADPIELTVSSEINQAIAVSIPQTNNSAASFSETVSVNLNDVVSNFSSVTDVNINALSYQYKNVTGNTDAVIESATIIINGNTIASASFVNMAQEANNGTVFTISDQAVLNQLESIFLNNSAVNIAFSGTAISDGGPVNFEIEISIDLTVTL